MTCRGHVKNGVVVIDDAVRLPEGAQVQVQLLGAEPVREEGRDIPTLYERLEPFVGAVEGLPPDASTNVDHYLYGHPKK